MSLIQRVQRKARRELLTRTAGIRGAAKAAIIGCGQIAPDHLSAFQESGVAAVVAVSDIRAGAMASLIRHYPTLRAFRDYRTMLNETHPDVISICTWPQHHLEIVRAAAQLGVKGILCEKPMALQMSEVEEMIAICKGAGVKLAIGHQYRFHSYFMHAAGMVARGALGKLVHVRGNIKDSVANNGPHLLDTIRFVLGDRPVRRVVATFERAGNKQNRGWPVEDGARGELTFDDGLVANVVLGDFSPTFFEIEIVGDKASLKVDLEGVRVDGKVVLSQPSDSAWYACRRAQFTDFVKWTNGSRASYSANADTSARSAELALAMYESGRRGGPVELPLSNKGDVIREFFGHPGATDSSINDRAPPVTTRPIARDAKLAMDGGRPALATWPSSRPHFGSAEAKGLARVMLSRQLGSTGGTEVAALEREFAAVYGAPKAVASTSGTAAIHVAVAAVNPNPCDEIITTAMSDMGTAIPILFANCVPVFADIDPLTGNLTAETIAKKITPRTRAVIVVHLLGRPANLRPIVDLLRPKGIALIEDCAQAHFAEYEGKKIGTFGDLGCFSLQQSKQITCGDGGLTLVNREDLIERASLFIDKGRSRKQGRVHLFLGANYRMTELQGTVARAQLAKGPGLIAARRTAASALSERLRQLSGIIVPQDPAGTRPSWWLYNFLIDEPRVGVSADAFCEALGMEGVPAMREYLPRPLFDEDVIAKRNTFGTSGYPFSAAADYVPPRMEDLPGLQEFFRRQIILTWNSRVTARHVDGIANAVAKLLEASGRVGDARPAGAREGYLPKRVENRPS
jgi:dTDP-4-amino-4,6-dideoxygalactose transaminase/predicted dehydrogenase